MTAKLYGFDRSLLHDTTEREPFVIDMVRADDYLKLEAQVAALQEQVRALAAENSIQDFIISAVKDLVRESEGVAGWHLNGDIATWDKVLPELNHSETPATDAALREIRADGAMACGVHLREWYDYQVEERAEEFAAAILAGEQP